MIRGLAVLVAVVLTGSAVAYPGEPEADPHKPRRTQVVAASELAAGWLHRGLFGADYRALWTVPIEVEVLDLASFGGGLEPVKRVGGEQTLGLALKGKDGRSYTFRSLVKDSARALPAWLEGTIAEGLVRDQAAAGHPGGALVAAELLRAVGVLASDPRLVVMPDDPALGQFRQRFAGVLGTIEEFPTVGFAGASEILGADEFHARMQRSWRPGVDLRAYLVARLMDHYLGDWDRHRGQWRWAQPPDGGALKPIPEDRDQAFARYEGLALSGARRAQPQLVRFGPRYAAIEGLAWNGREQDRRLLGALDRDAYEAASDELRSRLSDAAIDRAIERLPAAWQALDGARLRSELRSRRERMGEAALDFYRLLSTDADVHLSDDAEVVEIDPVAEGEIELRVRREDETVPFLVRRFRRGDTQELRVYLHGGDDQVTVRGRARGMRLRVIGGDGVDRLDDGAVGATRFYDEDASTELRSGRGTTLDRRPWRPRLDNPQAPWIPPRDWGQRGRIVPVVSYSSDDGFILGGFHQRKEYGFRAQPQAQYHVVGAAWSTDSRTARFSYHGELRGVNRRSYLELDLLVSGIETQRYHGYGNETKNEVEDEAFYRVYQDVVRVDPALRILFGPRASVAVGPTLLYNDVRGGDETLVGIEEPYGSRDFGQAGARIDFDFDSRVSRRVLASGYRLAVGGSYYPRWLDVEETFGEVHGEAAGYWLLWPRLQLAGRVGGTNVWGKYPFSEAAYVGGSATVRGLDRRRFRGDAALYGGAELRLKVGRARSLLPGEIGVFGLVDTGRVFLEGEESQRWHPAWGGGLWFSPLGDAGTFRVAVASSSEQVSVYFGVGFSF